MPSPLGDRELPRAQRLKLHAPTAGALDADIVLALHTAPPAASSITTVFGVTIHLMHNRASPLDTRTVWFDPTLRPIRRAKPDAPAIPITFVQKSIRATECDPPPHPVPLET